MSNEFYLDSSNKLLEFCWYLDRIGANLLNFFWFPTVPNIWNFLDTRYQAIPNLNFMGTGWYPLAYIMPWKIPRIKFSTVLIFVDISILIEILQVVWESFYKSYIHYG